MRASLMVPLTLVFISIATITSGQPINSKSLLLAPPYSQTSPTLDECLTMADKGLLLTRYKHLYTICLTKLVSYSKSHSAIKSSIRPSSKDKISSLNFDNDFDKNLKQFEESFPDQDLTKKEISNFISKDRPTPQMKHGYRFNFNGKNNNNEDVEEFNNRNFENKPFRNKHISVSIPSGNDDSNPDNYFSDLENNGVQGDTNPYPLDENEDIQNESRPNSIFDGPIKTKRSDVERNKSEKDRKKKLFPVFRRAIFRTRRKHSLSINSALVSLADMLAAKDYNRQLARQKAFRQQLLGLGK